MTIAGTSSCDHPRSSGRYWVVSDESLKLEPYGAPTRDSSRHTLTARLPPRRLRGDSAVSPAGIRTPGLALEPPRLGWSPCLLAADVAPPPPVVGSANPTGQAGDGPGCTCCRCLASFITVVQIETRMSPRICALSPENEISRELTSLLSTTLGQLSALISISLVLFELVIASSLFTATCHQMNECMVLTQLVA